MVLYDYRCSACGNIFERDHGMNESPEIICRCGGECKRYFGNCDAAISFKGKGFYVNDK